MNNSARMFHVKPQPITEGTPVFALLARGVEPYVTVGELIDEQDQIYRVYDPEGYSFRVRRSDIVLA